MPATLPPLASPDRFAGRDGSAHGGIRGHRHRGTGSHPGAGAAVGLEALEDGVWNASCGPLTRGRLLERHMKIEEACGRLTRTL